MYLYVKISQSIVQYLNVYYWKYNQILLDQKCKLPILQELNIVRTKNCS